MSDFTAVAEPPLERIVDAIRDRISPELILLFGSRATGGAHEDSDYDLMIVLRDGSDLERGRRDAYDALQAIGVGADVLVRSVSDYQRRQADPGFLDWLVSREGVLLHSSGAVPIGSAPSSAAATPIGCSGNHAIGRSASRTAATASRVPTSPSTASPR